ncbi:hypothetical protein HPB47_027350 [Ixodes persulcatus]|uniref:Uncharacterized protein n=1 Tax=Ixodes persulcatus TaxID=34615 RepID=A0AC60PW38_IXOPE|nr:hypothetical protein HPB47_027350 [Ixodes persulcatus]
MAAAAPAAAPAPPPKKGSYPSRQRRFGPAPLASFEDLPTDDQDSSPEGGRHGGDPSPDGGQLAKSPSLQSPDTLVSSEVSTPHVRLLCPPFPVGVAVDSESVRFASSWRGDPTVKPRSRW